MLLISLRIRLTEDPEAWVEFLTSNTPLGVSSSTPNFIILCLSSKTSKSDDMAAGKYSYWYKKSTSMIASQESFTRAAQVSSPHAPR